MANPSISSVTIDGETFNALSVHFGLSTMDHHVGIPSMSTPICSIEVTVDMHDTDNLPYATLQTLFQLASTVTSESIKDIQLTYWTDENKQDAICTYTFRGWIAHFSTTSGGGGGNHTLQLTFQPELDAKQFLKVTMGN